jgi:hypothetical protein
MRKRRLPPKKTYEVPKLLVYGDLTEMTKSGGMTGMTDMAKGNTMT